MIYGRTDDFDGCFRVLLLVCRRGVVNVVRVLGGGLHREHHLQIKKESELIKSVPDRASKGVKYLYALVVALVVAAIVAPAAFVQTAGNPGLDMINQLSIGVLALLAAGATIVIAVALFFAAKAFVNRVRS